MKKIIVFSSSGGGGHISAATAIKQYLEDDYDVKTVYIFDEVLGPLDPFKLFSFGGYTCENFYNFCLRKKWTWLLNTLFGFGRLLMGLKAPLIKRAIKNYLVQQKPCLVISVVPMVNNFIKSTCNELSIPFLLIPTDFDIKTFVSNITGPIPDSMQLALPFEHAQTLEILQAIKFPSQQVNYIDFPLRESFFEEKDLRAIKKDFHVPVDKKVIFLLMGSVGTDVIINYVKTLAHLDIPVHLVVCIGRNTALKRDLEKITLSEFVSISIVGQTDKIADLMAIADICITKAGSVSVAETIYSNVPMILDNTSTPLQWEAYNLKLIKEHGFGRVCNKLSQLNHLVKEILTNESYFDYLKNNLEDFPKDSFGKHLPQVVKKLIG